MFFLIFPQLFQRFLPRTRKYISFGYFILAGFFLAFNIAFIAVLTMITVQKIRQLRESRNITQEYMAAKLRISKTSYGNIERNTIKRLTLSMVMAIARVLNVHYTELLADERMQGGMRVSEAGNMLVLRNEMQQLLLKVAHIEDQLQRLLHKP